MDIFFSGSILAFVEYSIHFKTEHIQVQALAQWSSGMIPASGAGGPGFKSRLSPLLIFFLQNNNLIDRNWSHRKALSTEIFALFINETFS